jgi:hypothetical protein
MEPASNYRIHSTLPLANNAILITPFYPASCHFLPLRLKYLPHRHVSNPLSLCSALNMRDKVSHPHKATNKITDNSHREGCAPAVLRSCRVARFSLCRSHLNYTVKPSPIPNSRAVTLPCSERATMKENSQGHDTVRPGHSTACVNFTAASRRPVGATSKRIPGSSSGYHADFTKVVIRMLIDHEMNCSWRLPK